MKKRISLQWCISSVCLSSAGLPNLCQLNYCTGNQHLHSKWSGLHLPLVFLTHHKALVVSRTVSREPCRVRYNRSFNTRQTQRVALQTVPPKHTYGRVCANIATEDYRQLWQCRKCSVCSSSNPSHVLVGPHSDSTGFVRALDVYYA